MRALFYAAVFSRHLGPIHSLTHFLVLHDHFRPPWGQFCHAAVAFGNLSLGQFTLYFIAQTNGGRDSPMGGQRHPYISLEQVNGRAAPVIIAQAQFKLRLDQAFVRRPAKTLESFLLIHRHAQSVLEAFPQIELRFRQPLRGGFAEPPGSSHVIPGHAPAALQRRGQAHLAGGVATIGGTLEPLHRLLGAGCRAQTLLQAKAEADFRAGVALLR